MINSNLYNFPINNNNSPLVAGMSQLPGGVLNPSTVVPIQPPVTQGQPTQAQVPSFNASQYLIAPQPKQAPLADEWSPIHTGNKVIDYVANLFPNALHDELEILTGVSGALAHPVDTIIKPIGNWMTNVAPYESYGERLGDIVNALGAEAAGFDVKRTAEGYKKLFSGDVEGAKKIGNELRKEWVENFRKNPNIVASVMFPGPKAKLTGKAIKGAGQLVEDLSKGKVAWGEAGAVTGKIQDLATRDVYKQMQPVKIAAQELTKVSKEVGGNPTGNLEEVITAWRKGTEVPERLKPVEQAWTKFQEENIKLLPAEGLESSKSLAMNQWLADTRNITYNEAARNFRPLEEILYDGIKDTSAVATGVEERLKGLRNEFRGYKKDKLIKDLSIEETEKLLKYLEPDEINSLIEGGYNLKGAEQYLSEIVGDLKRTRGLKFSPEEQIIYNENLKKIADMAAQGDELAKDFIEAHSRFNSGLLKPVIQAGIKDIAKLGDLTDSELSGRRLAGKGSSREYGTATPKQIAEAYSKNIEETLRTITESQLDRRVTQSVLRGEFPDGTPLIDNTTKTIKHLSSELLQDGRLSSALRTARDAAFEGSIPIDIKYYGALKSQFGRTTGGPFVGVLNDAYNLFKDAVLNSGMYLGGNALSGAASAVVNSNVALLDDIVNAVKTKGKLAKELGVQRELGVDTRKFNTKPAKIIHKINRAFGGRVITDIDAAMQNTFAEIAAHAKLRRQGIKAADRLQAVSDAPKAKLAELIDDVRKVSLLNPSRRLVPESLNAITGLDPFFNWKLTAAQASYHTLMNHPLISQLVAANLFGTIGFDQELQRRTGLNVMSDKPLVSYRFDQRTGNTKEISMDFLPQMTLAKLLTKPEDLVRNIPLLTDLVNAAHGKSQYGKPLERTHSGFFDGTAIQGDKRYRRNPQTGQIEEIGTQADELISAILRDLTGIPNLVNKTVGPSLAGVANLVTGTDNYAFYQPYPQSVFGSFNYGQPDTIRAFFESGNPTRGRAGEETIRSILNQYETNYFPINQARINKNYYRDMGKRMRRENKALSY